MRVLALSAFLWLCVVGCGPDKLFITADLGPDENCKYAAKPSLILEDAVFDLDWRNHDCRRSYVAHLLTENPLPDTVRVEKASVLLTTITKQTITSFADGRLPNPFEVSAVGRLPADGQGLVPIEVVPSAYAGFLHDFEGGLIFAHVRLFGADPDGTDVESSPFDVRIEICEGCRTSCGWEVSQSLPACSDDLPELGQLWCIDYSPDCY